MRSHTSALYIFFFALFSTSLATKSKSRKREFGDLDTSFEEIDIKEARRSGDDGLWLMPSGLSALCDAVSEAIVSEGRVSTPHPRIVPSSNFFPVVADYTKRPLSRTLMSPLRRSASIDEEEYNAFTILNECETSWRRELISAIQSNDKTRLMHLIVNNINTDFRIISPVDPKTFTYPIHFALQHGLDAAALFLIDETEFGADLVDSFGHTPLSLAIELGKYTLFKALLDHSDLSIRVRGGLYVAHLAASSTSFTASYLEALKEHNANFLPVCLKRGWTPLQYAVAADHRVLAEWINKNTPCNVHYHANKLIVLDALKEGRVDLACSLISWGAAMDVEDEQGHNLLHLVAKTGDTNQQILSHFLKLDKETCYKMANSKSAILGYLPVHYAAEADNVEMMEFFYENLNLQGKTADGLSVAEVAIVSGATNSIEFLFINDVIDAYDSFSETNPPLLIKAYATGNMKMVQMLLYFLPENLYYGFDATGLNIIHHAVIKNDLNAIKMLVEEYEFNPNHMKNTLQDFPANSPLSWAIYSNNAAIVEYFLELDAIKEETVKFSLFTPEEYVEDSEEKGIDIAELVSIFRS